MRRLYSVLLVISLVLLPTARAEAADHGRLPTDGFRPGEPGLERLGEYPLAVDAVAEGLNVRLVGRWPYGACMAVAVSGNYAYIGNGAALQILDISDPTNIQLVSELDLMAGRGVYDLDLSDGILYAALGAAGIVLVDVSDPSAPVEAGFYDTPGEANCVHVAGNYAYVADYTEGLRVIDVSDPTAPAEAGYYDTPGQALGVYVSGNYAYVTDDWKGLRVIDVSDPTAPAEAGFYDTPGSAEDVHVSGSYAYVADAWEGLRVIDISDPTAPAEVGFYYMPENINGVHVSGNYAYVTDDWKGLRVINISDPSALVEAGFYDTPGFALGVHVEGNYAYVADDDGGLRVIDVSDPTAPTEAGYFDTAGYAKSVYVSGDYAYVADFDYGLRIIDVSDPTAPAEAGYYDTPGYASGIHVSGNYTYVADHSNGLRIIDISNPTAPTEAGYFDTEGTALRVNVIGNLAYVADGAEGLRVINVSDKGAPTEVGYYKSSQLYFYSVNVVRDIVYSVNGNVGLSILQNYGLRPLEPQGLTIRRASGEIILTWLKSSEPNISYYKVYRSTTGTFASTDSVAAVTDTTWTDTGLTDGTIYYYAVSAVNEFMLESEFADTVQVTFATGIDDEAAARPTSFSLSQNFPNPFNPETSISFALPQDCLVTLQIYNVTGQLVRALKDERMSAGYHSVRWDGRDSSGREVSSGVYFYRIEAGESFRQARRMVLLK